MTPPPAGRSYWICQAAGWGSFTAYVLGFYIAMAEPRHVSDVVSIILCNAVICPALTHELRRRFYLHDWFAWPLRRLVRLLAALTVGASAVLAGAVAVEAGAATGTWLPWQAVLGTFFGFVWALGGWLVIYYAVHARRRREALQLELAVVTREAQLRSLRAQVNPHFLFNCLNSLRHLILANPDRAVTMVTGLAELLRYSLASDRADLVPLADDLRIVDEYLDLERVRFEDRLRVERSIEPAALSAKIPPMLVLTLVENAIKHGISTLPDGGVVRLTARVSGSHVEIGVVNTGTFKPDPRNEGYGLANAQGRLRLLYRATASLTLRQAGDTTVADLRVPIEEPAPVVGGDAVAATARSGREARTRA